MMAGPTDPFLIVTGIKGFLKGETRRLALGEALVVGRSRSADMSLRKSQRLLGREDAEKLVNSEPFLSVSRQHVRIHFLHPGLVEVKDLSSNGTFVDGKRATCVAITDLDERNHVVSLGAVERLLLEMHQPGEEPTEVGEN